MGAGALRSAVLLTLVLLASPAYSSQADVELIPPGRYTDVAVREMGQATTSIHLTMYLITLPAVPAGSAVGRLVDALAAAVGRGVAVEVVLDRASGGGWEGAKNQAAARALAARGIPVVFDAAGTRTHAKALVMDGRTVLLGSSNWSEAALTQNVETNVLIRSPEVARALLAQVGGKGVVPERPVDDPTAVPIPWAFLNDRALLGRMVSSRDEGAFDLYLYLLKAFGAQRGEPRAVAAGPMAAALGVPADWSITAQRKAVAVVLRRLQRTYGVLTVVTHYGRDPVVTLTASAAPVGLDDPVVRVPAGYWDWGWDRRLPLAGKVMYLLGLHYAAVSPTAPVWFRSERDLAAQHGFEYMFAGQGVMALRRQHLLEVTPGPLNPGHYDDRPANRYVPQPLYDPAVVAQRLSTLQARYGRAAVARVTGYAAGVYEDHHAEAIERLLQLEASYGPAVVRTAAHKVTAMSAKNPKKTLEYLVGTIESMGREPGRK